MTKTIEVEIDAEGHIHPLDPATVIPAGRAVLFMRNDEQHESYLLSEAALSDWLRPEEDEAWAYLQPDK